MGEKIIPTLLSFLKTLSSRFDEAKGNYTWCHLKSLCRTTTSNHGEGEEAS